MRIAPRNRFTREQRLRASPANALARVTDLGSIERSRRRAVLRALARAAAGQRPDGEPKGRFWIWPRLRGGALCGD